MKVSPILIRDVVRVADGEIVGRIRLQKILYLLNAKGLNITDAEFHYHHYGPYSRVLDEALERAKALSGVVEEIRHRVADGAPFSVFRVRGSASLPAKIGDLDVPAAKKLLNVMKARTSTVLELAATIHWLTSAEKVEGWREEVVRRKGIKTENGRLDEAIGLLHDLDIAVPVAAHA